MPGSHPEQRERGALGGTPSLFPVSERVHTDTQSLSKLLLRQTDEASKRRHIMAAFELPAENPRPLLPRNRPGKVLICQFTKLVTHLFLASSPRTDAARPESPSLH